MVNATLYLLNYNNYYNRQVKKEASLAGYLPYLVKYNGQDVDSNNNSNKPSGINFIPGDYVNTQQVIN